MLAGYLVLASWHFTCFKRSLLVWIPLGKYKSINGGEPSALDGECLSIWPSICIYQKATDPMHIQAGNHAVAENNRAFQPFKDGEGERQFEHVVKFKEPFAEVPQILVAFNRLDIASHAPLRVNVTAEKISPTGFTLRYSTWANTQIFGIGAYWMAFHAALSDFRLTGRIL